MNKYSSVLKVYVIRFYFRKAFKHDLPLSITEIRIHNEILISISGHKKKKKKSFHFFIDVFLGLPSLMTADFGDLQSYDF